jgi:hypothetical protein
MKILVKRAKYPWRVYSFETSTKEIVVKRVKYPRRVYSFETTTVSMNWKLLSAPFSQGYRTLWRVWGFGF